MQWSCWARCGFSGSASHGCAGVHTCVPKLRVPSTDISVKEDPLAVGPLCVLHRHGGQLLSWCFATTSTCFELQMTVLRTDTSLHTHWH